MKQVFAIITLMIASVIPALAAVCPDESPMPLRAMYLQSDVVVVGRPGTPTKWQLVSEDGYKTYHRVVPIVVEETVKGTFTDLSVLEVARFGTNEKPGFSAGLAENKERRVFFLLQDETHGMMNEIRVNRSLPAKAEEVKLYTQRLHELHAIYSAPQLSKPALVEWLVRMAEDPATRFDGAMELSSALRYRNVRLEEQSGVADGGEPAGDVDTGTAPIMEVGDGPVVMQRTEDGVVEQVMGAQYVDEGYFPGEDGDMADPEFADLLTPAQKNRLTAAFLKISFNYTPRKADYDDGSYVQLLNEADEELMLAVLELRDWRAVYRILDELPKASQTGSWQVTSMLNGVTAFFNDREMMSLVQRYFYVAHGDAGEAIDDKAAAYDIDMSERRQDDPESDLDGYHARTREFKAELAKLPAKSYGQRRTELIAKVLNRAGEISK